MKKITVMLLSILMMSTMTLDQYLAQVQSNNPVYRAMEINAEASMDKLESAEIELSPVLTASYQKGRDKSLPNQLSADRSMEMYTLGVAKKFVTGTSLELKANVADFENKTALIPSFTEYSTGVLGVSVKQSLWKDFFGYGTRTSIERKTKTAQIDSTAADLQNQALLAEAESIYWDYVFAQEDLKLKKSNLDRATQLHTWMSRRVQNGTGEKADGFNSSALKSLRELEYAQSQTDYKNAESKFRETLNLNADQNVPLIQFPGVIKSSRIEGLSKKKNMVQVQALISYLEAQARYYAAEETVDQLRPDLSLFGTYNYTSYNKEHSQAVSDMTDSDYPQYVVGASFVWQFDNSAKNSLIKASKKQAEAFKMMAEKKLKDGEQEWQKFARNYEVLTSNLKLVEQIADFQKKRAQEENIRLSRGRTVTANVITAETDSAEAAINLLKTQIGILKMEAASRTFVDADTYLKNLER